FLITGILFGKVSFKNAYLEKLTSKYEPIIQEVKILKGSFKRVTMVKNYLSREYYSLEILTELYNFVPGDLCLNDIKFDRSGNFSVKGISKSIPTVFAFVYSMKESKYFRNVKTKRTTKREKKGEEVVDFEIMCMLGREGK
ncbi:PilN domain-containing protein, partial [candidate division WOR-3 bacterium]|nr:PilN domain-containing protein [candidate division WOR-3 bacterium]